MQGQHSGLLRQPLAQQQPPRAAQVHRGPHCAEPVSLPRACIPEARWEFLTDGVVLGGLSFAGVFRKMHSCPGHTHCDSGARALLTTNTTPPNHTFDHLLGAGWWLLAAGSLVPGSWLLGAGSVTVGLFRTT